MQRTVIFPGQGAQCVGMGMDLAHHHPLAREILDQADGILGFALSDVIANGSDAELTRTVISQPAILTVSWMALAVLRQSCGAAMAPFTAPAGLSLGEYTALVAAEAISFEDALRLVHLRGQAMQTAADARSGGMVALIGADETVAQAVCLAAAEDAVLTVANLNCPGQVVIAGDQAACQRAVPVAKEMGVRRAMLLKVAGAFHSPLMAPAAQALRQALAAVRFQDPCIPVISNVTAAPVVEAAAIADLLVDQLTSPVRWADSMQALWQGGCRTFYEVGPGATLSGLLSRTVEEPTVSTIGTAAEVLAAVPSLRVELG